MIFNARNSTGDVKERIHEYIVNGRHEAVNPQQNGTKVAARYRLELAPGESKVVRLRFSANAPTFDDFDTVFASRIAAANDFYFPLANPGSSEDLRRVQRQAIAGMLWTKQFYCYDVRTWLYADPG